MEATPFASEDLHAPVQNNGGPRDGLATLVPDNATNTLVHLPPLDENH